MPGRIGRKADVRRPCQAGARAVGGEVQLEAELFQRTGSFRVRGAINRALLTSSASSGEHARPRYGDDVVLLDEDEIAEGMRFTYARTKLAAEPGGSIGVGLPC